MKLKNILIGFLIGFAICYAILLIGVVFASYILWTNLFDKSIFLFLPFMRGGLLFGIIGAIIGGFID